MLVPRDGKVVTRFAISTQACPEEPKAFSEVQIASCYVKPRTLYWDSLPEYVKPEDVVRAPELEHQRARLRDMVATVRLRIAQMGEECADALAGSGFSTSDVFRFELSPELREFLHLPIEEELADREQDDVDGNEEID